MRAVFFQLIGIFGALLIAQTPGNFIWFLGLGFFAGQDAHNYTVSRWPYDFWVSFVLAFDAVDALILLIGMVIVIAIDLVSLPLGSADSLALLTLFYTLSFTTANVIILVAALLGILYGTISRTKTIAFLPFLLVASCIVIPFTTLFQ